MAARRRAGPLTGSRRAASVGRQARQGERHIARTSATAKSRGPKRGHNAYSSRWPRNGDGEWTKRCTGRRSACNKGRGKHFDPVWGPDPGW